jgi:c(7)-type cytochrome triheme protein
MGLKCTNCHDKLYTNAKQHKKNTMKQMQKGKSCGACHNGKAAFGVAGDCAKCHKK